LGPGGCDSLGEKNRFLGEKKDFLGIKKELLGEKIVS
jgi:hypothetical protein